MKGRDTETVAVLELKGNIECEICSLRLFVYVRNVLDYKTTFFGLVEDGVVVYIAPRHHIDITHIYNDCLVSFRR